MLKILRITNRLNLGGPTFNVAYLSKYLAPEFETMLVAGMKDETEASSEFILKEMGLEPVYIPEMKRSINPSQDRIAFIKLKEIMQKFKPDIVHTHAAKSGTLGRLAAIQCGVPVILHTFHGHVFHSYFNPVKTKVFLEIERYLAKKSTRIIAISDLQKDELANQFKICDEQKIEVVPLGFDLSRFETNLQQKRAQFRKEYLVSDDEIAVGIIGRIVPVKNHRMFIDSLIEVLNSTRKKVRGFIVGDGEDKQKMMDYATSRGLDFVNGEAKQKSAPLTFTSWIKEIDLVNAGMDIIALTSLNEGTPVSLIEAQAANKPIVSTRVGGIEDVVLEGETALLSPVEDGTMFANNLLRLVNQHPTSNGSALKGRDFVKEKFHYERLVSDMKALYYRLLGEEMLTTI